MVQKNAARHDANGSGELEPSALSRGQLVRWWLICDDSWANNGPGQTMNETWLPFIVTLQNVSERQNYGS